MPSGKPRPHRTNRGVSKKEQWTQLRDENRRLRELIARGKHKDRIWKAIDDILRTLDELEDMSTSLISNTWEGTGSSVEQPTFKGVRMAPAVDDPGYDPDRHKGDRSLTHNGTYAEALSKWVLDKLEWIPKTVEDRFRHLEPDPEPASPPKPRVPISG